MLTWKNTLEIGEELFDANPDLDPTTLRFTELHDMVCSLPDFSDDPEKSSEAILEVILQAWLDERD